MSDLKKAQANLTAAQASGNPSLIALAARRVNAAQRTT